MRLVAINGVWLDKKATLRGIVKAVQALSKSNTTMRNVCVHILRPEYNRKSALAALAIALCANECHAIICCWANLMHLHTDITCIENAKFKKKPTVMTAVKPESAPGSLFYGATPTATPGDEAAQEMTDFTQEIVDREEEASEANVYSPAPLPALPETVYSEAEVEEMRAKRRGCRGAAEASVEVCALKR